MDSGAPTIYNELSRSKNSNKGQMGSYLKDRKFDDYSYTELQEFKDYRDKYIGLVKKHESNLFCYVNLDIINNQEKSYEMLKYLESQGLNPIPVYHFGCDVKWLKKYIDEGYDYIGIGGIVPNPSSIIIPALDRIWSDILTDKNGYPLVKVHGFAVATPKLATRWPWFSCDSTSWVKFGLYGGILVPKRINGKYDYTKSPYNVLLSIRTKSKSNIDGNHINSLSECAQREVREYIESKGFVYGKSEIKKVTKEYKCQENEWRINDQEVEVVLEAGMSNNHFLRDMLNAIFYLDMEKSVPEWPWPFKQKSKRGFGVQV